MDIVLLVVSAVCFISAWGIHVLAKIGAKENCLLYCGYMSVPWMTAIPWLSGFVLAVIPEVYIFNLAWYWVFLINIPITLLLGNFVAAFILKRFASGRGAGFDILISMTIGIVTLVIGVIIH